jgi:hypothetical protein
MDLQKEILREHSRKQMLKIADYVGNDPSRFKTLVEVYLAGPYRVTQRGAWPLSLCVERHPELIKPHLNIILKYLNKPGIHDAVKRNTMRLLQFVEIPKRFHGIVADLCFIYLTNKSEPVAVKVFAMSALLPIIQDKPELCRELKIILEEQFPYGSAGFRSRAGKVLRTIAPLQN